MRKKKRDGKEKEKGEWEVDVQWLALVGGRTRSERKRTSSTSAFYRLQCSTLPHRDEPPSKTTTLLICFIGETFRLNF